MVEDQSDHYPKRRNHPIREQHVAAIPNTCVLNELIIRKKALLLVVQLCAIIMMIAYLYINHYMHIFKDFCPRDLMNQISRNCKTACVILDRKEVNIFIEISKKNTMKCCCMFVIKSVLG